MAKVTLDRQRRRDLDDLIGGDEPAKKKGGRPRKSEEEKAETRRIAAARKKRERNRDIDDFDDDDYSGRAVYKLHEGVNRQWLASAFRVTRHLVNTRIVKLKPISYGPDGNPLYDFVEAAALLIDANVDVEEALSRIKPDKLPENLREAVWNSRLKQQRWEEKAGHLWRTEVILERFGEVLLALKGKVEQIPDRVERLSGLSIEQYRLIKTAVDQVQEEMHEEILAFAKLRKTPNQLGEMREEEEKDLI